MNWRKRVYLSYAKLRGYGFPSLLRQYLREYDQGVGAMTSAYALHKLLCHCHRAVPFYSERLEDIGFSPKDQEDPVKYLSRLPLLTKEEIRSNFKDLQS